MNTTLKDLLEFADKVGVVSKIMCYDKSFCDVEGKTRNGEEFEITLRIKEEEKNAE